MNYIVVVMPRRIDENGSTELFELAGVFVWGVAYIGSTVTTESDGFTTMVANKDVQRDWQLNISSEGHEGNLSSQFGG